MNCQGARKYLFAFADGQLSVHANCEVLDHLKMCPACSAIVDEHQSLRQALHKSAERTPLPQGLHARVRRAIRVGAPVKPAESRKRAGSPMVRLLAMAAALALAVTAVWYFADAGADGLSDRLFAAGMSDQERIGKDILLRHGKCVPLCDSDRHHHAALPRERTSAAAALSDQFGREFIAVAPDLARYGFEFESANFCCIEAADGCMAAHVMYVNPQYNARLSVFAVPRWAALDKCGDGGIADCERPFIYSEVQCDNVMNVVAWHDGATTYICCGPVHDDELRDLARDIQTAMGRMNLGPMFAAGADLQRPGGGAGS